MIRKKIFLVLYNYTENTLLIVKDRKTKEWSLISGGCKMNEDYVECALRELKEEVGIHISKHNYKHVPIYEYQSDYFSNLFKSKNNNKLLQYNVGIVFIPINNNINVKESNEIMEGKWCNFNYGDITKNNLWTPFQTEILDNTNVLNWLIEQINLIE